MLVSVSLLIPIIFCVILAVCIVFHHIVQSELAFEIVFGHLSVAIGNLYSDQGKMAEVEEMYQRALDGQEKALGCEHTSTLNTVNSLGNLYADQEKMAEAEKMY